jgi:peptidoglycan/LPS O-acetylase OafA/YrhL
LVSTLGALGRGNARWTAQNSSRKIRRHGAPSIKPIAEIRSLTGLRGIAALYVLLFHYFPLAATSNFSNPLKRVLDHGYLAVDIFFVLSGFVMAMNYGRSFAAGWSWSAYLRFLGRRIARIYPLYLVATITGFVFVTAGWLNYTHAFPRATAVMVNLLMIQAWGFVGSFDSPAWSISAEWAAYLVFPALLMPTMFRRSQWGWLGALICAAVLALLCVLPPSLVADYDARTPLNFNGYWHAFPVVRCIPGFTLGILAFRVAGSSVGRRLAASRWVAPALCLTELVLLGLPKTDLCIVLLVPLLVVALASEVSVPGRLLASAPIERLGKLSFSIYLVHKLLLGLESGIYARAHAAGLPHAQTLAAAACIALTFPLALAAYRIIEVPGRRALRTVFEHRTFRFGTVPSRV